LAPTGQNSTGLTDPSAAALQATRDILDAIHRHRDDEQPIFDVILQSAAHLCDAPLAGLTLVNDARDRLLVKSVWGDLNHRLPAPEDGVALDSDVFPARAFRSAEVLHIGDMKTVPEYVAGDPRYVALVEQHGFNAYLCVPLIMNGAPIGHLDLFRTTPQPFDDAEIALIETFATQAVIAIENARQFRKVQERLERETATGEVLGVISTSRNDELRVLDTILAQACRLCDAPFAFLCLVDPQGNMIRAPATHGGGSTFVDAARDFETSIDTPLLIGQSAREKQVISIRDLREEQRLRPVEEDARLRTIKEQRIRSVLYVPLINDGVGRVCVAVAGDFQVESRGEVEMKGIREPVEVLAVA